MAAVGRGRQYLVATILFVLLFIVTGALVARYQLARDHENLAHHARVIADDVWAINPAGVKNYLRLAMEAHAYRHLQVNVPGGEVFTVLTDPDPKGLLGFLHTLGLVPTREMQAPISHEGLAIGSLEGLQYVQLVFSLVRLLAIYLFVLLIALSILFLIDRRRTLEQLVRERTRSLQESQRRFHDLVNLLPEMVLETDLEGMVLYANNEARSRLGLGQEVQSGVSLFAYFPADEQLAVRDHFKKVLEEGTLYQGRLLDHRQRPFPVLMRSGPILQNGRRVGSRLLLVDITERQRLEQQLNRDRKMKAIGLMAGGVAHDLNNILSGIVSYPELLLLKLGEGDPMYRPLTQIRKAGLQASQVVEDLLTVARGSRGDKQVVDANELIQDYLDSPDFAYLRSRFPQVAHDFVPEEELLHLLCSPIHFRKCLMNLVVNGFEAINGTGEVRIHTQNVRAGAPHIHELGLPDDTPYIRITVSDTGPGIDPEELERIFEPFYSRKVMGRSGTGLGLTVVYNTVRDHDGTTRVRSSEAGTTFDLYFPATEATVRETAGDLVIRGNGESILVVDDEPRQREIAATMLTTLGYVVRTAANGAEASMLLLQEPADLVVLDMILGAGQPCGREVYRQILETYPRQKAIVASGYAEDDDVRQTLAMGAGAFVAKPYTLAIMSRAVQTALRAEMAGAEMFAVR